MANAMTLLQDEHELALTVADLPWGKIDVDGLETKAERIRLQIERIESDPELAQLQDELKQLLRQKDDEGKNRYRAEAELENVQHAVQAEQAWLDMHGDSDFDDAALSDMVSNLLADTYETCFDTSRPQERPQRIAGGFDREGRRRSTCACCAESATPCVRDSSRSTSVPSNCAPTRNAPWATI